MSRADRRRNLPPDGNLSPRNVGARDAECKRPAEAGLLPTGARGCYIRAIIAWPKPEQDT
jgi:hypothetical protein